MLTHFIQYTNASNRLDNHYGIPVSPEDVTQNWCDYQTTELDNPIFYYIRFDESLTVVLGEPINFEVTTPPPFE